jgi:hypothetical protein
VPRRLGTVGGLAILIVLCLSGGLNAQGLRGWVGSTVRYIELRPIGLDTIPSEDLLFDGDGNATWEGRSVPCTSTSTVCAVYSPREPVGTLSATQELRFTAWGFGVRGLSSTVYLRNRVRNDSDFVWPRTDDRFDVLLAYAQLDRGPFRVRLGRQEATSGLGFAAYDGATVDLRIGRANHLEVFGGRSLARGLREGLGALSGVDDFILDRDAYLLGAAASGEIGPLTDWAVRYQREILSDRSVLVSERASLDASTIFAPVRVSGSVDYDFAFGRIGKSHLQLQYALPGGRLMLELTGRRYVPYFQLSTIWGFFNPVAYNEGELRASWAPVTRLGIWATGGVRTYGDTETAAIFGPLEDDAVRVGAGTIYRLDDHWSFDASYRMERGNGAFLNSGDINARWRTDRLNLAATVTSFQQIEEFRLGDGRVVGGSLAAGYELLDGTWLDGAMSMYLHRPEGDGARSDWDQLRAWMSVRVELGRDPGAER